jgi:hypothetical protein
MIVAALLVIIAIMLFGSSAVLGAIGHVLGFLALLVGLSVLIYYTRPFFAEIPLGPEYIFLGIVLVLLGVYGAFRLLVFLFGRRG